MANKNFRFTLNTNGACLICYKQTEKNKPSSSFLSSLTTICHLLKVNLAGMFSQPDKSLDVKVILCQRCSSMHNEFLQLYQELEAIRMKLDNCLEGINGKMARSPGQRSESKVGIEYESDSDDDDDDQKQTNIHPGMAEVLRKEIKLKCRSYMETSQSQVTMKAMAMTTETSLEIGPTFLAPVVKQEGELISADDPGDHDLPSYAILTMAPDIPVFKTELEDNDSVQDLLPTFETNMGHRSGSDPSTKNRKKDRSRSLTLEGKNNRDQLQSKLSGGAQCHQCKYCSKLFGSQKERRSHILKHHCIQSVKCQYCNKLFANKRSKDMHIRNGCCPVLKEKKSPPTMAGIQQAPTSKLSSDIMKPKEVEGSPNSSTFPCKFCWNSFATRAGLGVHVVKTHSKTSKINICPICKKSFLTMGSLKQHQRVIHCLLCRFSCKSCLQSFDSEYGLQKHETLMCKSNPNAQAGQGPSYSSASAFSSDIFVVAGPLATSSHPVASSSRRVKQILNIRNHVPCPLCGRIFTAETDLFEHQRLECEVLMRPSGIHNNDKDMPECNGEHHKPDPDQFQQIKEEEPEQSANIFLDPDPLA